MKKWTEDEVLGMIREKIDASSVSEVAHGFGVTPSYLYYVMKGERHISGKVCKVLGLRAVIVKRREVYFVKDGALAGGGRESGKAKGTEG